jgi:hypothetical protein
MGQAFYFYDIGENQFFNSFKILTNYFEILSFNHSIHILVFKCPGQTCGHR